MKTTVLKGVESSTLFVIGDISITEIAEDEVMSKEVAPGIKEIVDTTNHASGIQRLYPRNEVPL